MNILNNIGAEAILIRTFTASSMDSPISTFERIPIHRIYGPDPQFIQFSPFESGYEISFTLTTCADLRYIADQNLLVEIIILSSDGPPIQVGDYQGFKMTDVLPPPSPGKALFVYNFKTIKPNTNPFKIRSYD